MLLAILIFLTSLNSFSNETRSLFQINCEERLAVLGADTEFVGRSLSTPTFQMTQDHPERIDAFLDASDISRISLATQKYRFRLLSDAYYEALKMNEWGMNLTTEEHVISTSPPKETEAILFYVDRLVGLSRLKTPKERRELAQAIIEYLTRHHYDLYLILVAESVALHLPDPDITGR